MELLKQKLCHPYSLHEQVMILTMANKGIFDEVPTKEVRDCCREVFKLYRFKTW